MTTNRRIRRRPAARAVLIATAVAAMVAAVGIAVPTLAAATPAVGAPATGAAGLAERAAHGLAAPAAADLVPGHSQSSVSVAAARPQPLATPAAAPRWPAAGTATVNLTSTSARTASAQAATAWSAATGLPVQIAAVATSGTRVAAVATTPVSRLTIQMADHAAAGAAGVNGVLFSLARADAVDATGQVQVRVDDSAFAQAYGGGYASRLTLVRMPACALSTPGLAACRTTTPLATSNDAAAQTLTAPVTVGPAAGAAVVIAATATTSGGTGDFKATSLAPSAAWQVGLQTGDFSWSYPLRMPPPIGGTAPDLSLSYDSGSSDGETAADNSQPGQLGEGFALSGGGYIERKYAACADHVGDASNTTNQKSKTGDLCWDGDNAYLVLDGHATELIQDASSGTWRLATDDGSTVKELTGAANGAYNGEYWEVIAPDGTQYYFGKNELPGWASGDTAANSVWTVPVVGLKTGDPCHTATYSTAACKTMPWRWNLDLAVDANGNATEYFYNPLVNYYAFGTTASAAGTKTSYDAGGTLTEIDYGSQSSNVYNRRPIQVIFGYVDRCTSTTQSTCAANENGTYWPDTPWDLDCTSSATCTGSGHDAPAFFDTQMLSTITTSVYEGSPGNVAVDTWKLGYVWLSAEVNSDLFLSSITHTGDVGGSTALSAVSFGATGMINRVPGDGYPAMTRYRVASITTESGAQIDVTYNAPDCGSTRPDPGSDTLPCWQQKWSPGDLGDAPVTSWFYKYTVHEVDVDDATGGEPVMPTVYTYVGGAAWHYDTSMDLQPTKDRNYSQWRGYAHVDVVSGAAGNQSQTDNTFMRGMDHDPIQPAGGFSAATVQDSRGDPAVTDTDTDNGFQLEQVSYDGLAGSTVISDTVSTPWTSAATATSASQPWGGPLTAVLTGTAQTDTYAPLSTGGTRHTEVQNTMNAATGLITQTNDRGDVAVASQATCTATTYAQNATKGILDDRSEVKVTAGTCGTTSPALVSDTRYDYDSGAFGAAPTAGDVTETDVYSAGDPGVADHWVAQSRDAYDSYGRVVSVENSANATTATSYTSAYGTGRATTQTVVTDPLGHTTTTAINPAWGLTTQVTDQAGAVTSYSYDALGRVSAAWLPGESQSAGNPASYTYSYSETPTKPSSVTTKALIDASAKLYTATIELFDSELRERQLQTAAEGTTGGTEVTDTFYDSRGNTVIQNGPYPANTTPSASLWITSEPEVPNEAATSYDGDNRPTEVDTDSDGVLQWKATYSYPGVDAVTKVPPAGGTVTTTLTDARGNTTAVDQYHSTTAASGPFDATTYTYTPAGKLATVTDAAGNHWSNTYDTLGRQIATTTPDAGTSTSAYNDLGLVTAQTDARGKTVSFVYDNDQRETAEYDTTGGVTASASDQVSAWTYDTSAVGRLASTTAYVGGTGGEAYKQTMNSYNPAGKPTSVTYTIPSNTLTGTLAGTYTFTSTYNADGTIATQSYPAAGGLPAETVDSGYNNLGSPYSLFSTLSDYVQQSFYAPNGQPARDRLRHRAVRRVVPDAGDLRRRRGSPHQQSGPAGVHQLGQRRQHRLRLRQRGRRHLRPGRGRRRYAMLRLRLRPAADQRLGTERDDLSRCRSRCRRHRRPCAVPAGHDVRQRRPRDHHGEHAHDSRRHLHDGGRLPGGRISPAARRHVGDDHRQRREHDHKDVERRRSARHQHHRRHDPVLHLERPGRIGDDPHRLDHHDRLPLRHRRQPTAPPGRHQHHVVPAGRGADLHRWPPSPPPATTPTTVWLSPLVPRVHSPGSPPTRTAPTASPSTAPPRRSRSAGICHSGRYAALSRPVGRGTGASSAAPPTPAAA